MILDRHRAPTSDQCCHRTLRVLRPRCPPHNHERSLVERPLEFARLTDPILVPLRRVIPPLRVGAAGIDLSPLILFFALEIIVSRLH